MLSCADATRRMSEGLDHHLSWPARMSLRMHVLMCGACRRYGRQIRGVEELLRDYDSGTGARDEDGSPDGGRSGRALRLSPGKRDGIKRSLRS